MENRYDKYKDSGIEWIGEIPEHWNKICLKRLSNINTGNQDTQDSVSDGKYPFFVRSPKVERSNKYTFEGASILMAGDGIGAGKVFHLADDKFACHQRVYCINQFKKVNRIYLFYYLSSLFYHVIESANSKSTVDSVRLPMLAEFPIFMPISVEQQTIATYLDQKCGEIDELITLQEEMITKLQRYKQSVITEAVTKGLDKNVPLKDSGIEWIGEIPEHWEVKRLKYFGNNYNGLTYSPNDICNSQEGTIVLRSSNIKDNKLCFDDNVYVNKEIPTKLFVNKGDILICSRNGSASLIGKAALIETDIKATFGAFMMIFKGNNIHHKYLYYIVTSCISQYKWLFTTATINQLTSSMLGEIFAPSICDRLEQQTIADYLDKKCSEIDELISIKQQKIEKLKDYKKSLIFECVTGKRKVS